MTDWMETNRAVVFPRNCDHLGHLNVRWHGHFFDDAGFICGRRLGYGTRRMSPLGYKRKSQRAGLTSALTLIADIRLAMSAFCCFTSAFSGDLSGSSQHLIFLGKMECWDETKTSDIFYSRAEERDMGSLATWRVHEFNRTWV